MGLASLFRKKTNYFKTTIEPQCSYCQYGMRGKSEDSSMIFCEKKGPMKAEDSCKKFCYSPLKRIPVKQLNIEGIDSANELYAEINEEELAAKQAAAAKAAAAEKAHAEKAAAAAKAQEEAAARAEAEAKAKAEAEAKAKAEAEARAKAEAEARAKAEAEARAKAEAEAEAKANAERQAQQNASAAPQAPAAQPNPLDEIARAAEEAARIGVPNAPKPAAPTPAAAPAPAPAPAAAPAPAPAPMQAPAFEMNSAAGIDDEFADLDDVEGADVIEVEEHEEVMKSKKSTLVAESAQHKGPVPNLPSASAFLRESKKKSGSSSGSRRQAPPPPTAMMQAPPKKSNPDDKK